MIQKVIEGSDLEKVRKKLEKYKESERKHKADIEARLNE